MRASLINLFYLILPLTVGLFFSCQKAGTKNETPSAYVGKSFSLVSTCDQNSNKIGVLFEKFNKKNSNNSKLIGNCNFGTGFDQCTSELLEKEQKEKTCQKDIQIPLIEDIKYQIVKFKSLSEQGKKLIEQCPLAKEKDKKNPLDKQILSASSISTAELALSFGINDLKEEKVTFALATDDNISATRNDAHPVEVTVARDPPFFSGHAKLFVTYGEHITKVSYPEDIDLDFLQMMYQSEFVGPDATAKQAMFSKFYISKAAYANYLFEYRTSKLTSRQHDIYTLLDQKRRAIGERIADLFPPSIDSDPFQFLKSLRGPRQIFFETKHPDFLGNPETTRSYRSIKHFLETKKFYDSATPSSVRDVMTPLSAADKTKFKEFLNEYSTIEELLKQYTEGKEINIESIEFETMDDYTPTKNTFKMDPSFEFSMTELNQQFEQLETVAGKNKADIKANFMEITGQLVDFSEDRKTRFTEYLYGVANRDPQKQKIADDLFGYMEEGVKQRTRYGIEYSQYGKDGGINCAGTVCKFLGTMSPTLVTQHKTGIFPRTPFGTLLKVKREVRKLKIAEKKQARELLRRSKKVSVPQASPLKARISISLTEDNMDNCSLEYKEDVLNKIMDALESIEALSRLQKQIKVFEAP